ncbi:MAG: DUF3667 domain-containing protein [Ignavibacteria bacterium]|nr:DUF3667 domain-containing protein [Ignavibacteria bacterium]
MNEKIKIEHICQNCGKDLNGKYCSNCGQRGDAVLDRSVLSIFGQFFEEAFDWDSKFFRSVKYLFTRPGFLTHEYISGRINSYVSPLKMFLFTSFILFFIMIKSDPNQYKALVTESDNDDFLKQFILDEQKHSNKPDILYKDEFNNQFNNNITIYIFAIMFLFSIILKLVYLPKNYYYSEHFVFTLHFFTFTLWCFLLAVIFQSLGDFSVLIFFYMVPGVYLFFAVKKVYHKTFWKAILVSLFMTFSFWFLLTSWIFFTIFASAYLAA